MSDFKFEEYFSSEGIDIIGAVISFFKKKSSPKELTLGDLELAAFARKLK